METKQNNVERITDTRAITYVNSAPPHAPRPGGGLGGVLTRLFINICYDITGGHGVSPPRWNELMNDYIRIVSEKNNSIDRTSIRGNSNKQLHKPMMTWNVLFKGLQFLKFEAFTIGICGQTKGGKEFNAYTSVSFIKNTRFEPLFPKELPGGHAVMNKRILAGRHPKRNYSTEPGGVLSKLFDLICLDITDQNGFTPGQWKELVDQWTSSAHNTHKANAVNDKSNTNKEFRGGKMTWKVFCKGMRFLEITNFTLYITAYRTDGLISNCETSVNFAPSK